MKGATHTKPLNAFTLFAFFYYKSDFLSKPTWVLNLYVKSLYLVSYMEEKLSLP